MTLLCETLSAYTETIYYLARRLFLAKIAMVQLLELRTEHNTMTKPDRTWVEKWLHFPFDSILTIYKYYSLNSQPRQSVMPKNILL